MLRHPRDEQVCLIATGSEVGIALRAAELLAADGIVARIVSMPCVEAFERQDARWREEVIPRRLPRLAIEAGCTAHWWKYVGEAGVSGDVVGLDRFGESAPAGLLFKHFGITPEAVAARARALVAAHGAARAEREALAAG